jgi:hypothetical protein
MPPSRFNCLQKLRLRQIRFLKLVPFDRHADALNSAEWQPARLERSERMSFYGVKNRKQIKEEAKRRKAS